jgi:hypothetical protein
MKKRAQVKFVAVFFVVAVFCGLVQFSSQPSTVCAKAVSDASMVADASENAASGGNFSVIWITDTQYLTESYPTYYEGLCHWIVNNAEKYNVQMVIHTGDIVDTEGNTTQWECANRSMSILWDAGIPYTWNAGNHDYNATCWIGNQYAAFNPASFAQEPYWIGDFGDGQNTAVHFAYNGIDFLVVNLEYNADDEALAWANNVLDAYPDAHAIVGAHFYLNRTGGYETWATNLKQTVLATHQNVFLTLSAHVYPLAYSGLQTQVGDRHELVFNRQEKDSEMGATSLRILTFDTANNVIDVQTFVIYSNIFLKDEHNQFTLNTNFWNAAAVNEEIPEFPTAIASVAVLAFATAIVVGVRRGKKKQRT